MSMAVLTVGTFEHSTERDGTPGILVEEAVEEHIRNVLASDRPDDGFLGEEGGQSGDPSTFWIVDPIDGTRVGDKSDLLAAPSLVSRWARRNVDSSGTLSMIAEMSSVDSDLAGTLAVARSIYGHLPQGGTPLWQGRKQVLTLNPGLALEAMAFTS